MTTAPDSAQWEPHHQPNYPFPPPPPPGRASQRIRRPGRSRRRRIILGAIFAVLALMIVGGVLAGQHYERAYDQGHAAYLDGNCVAALDKLGDAATASDKDLAARARADQQECQAYLAAGDLRTQGEASKAALAYSEFLVKYPRSPMAPAVLTEGRTTIAQAPADLVGSAEVCTELDRLQTQQLVSPVAEVLPPLLRTCAETLESSGDLVAALGMLSRFRTDFPDHPLRADVDAAFVRVSLAEAEASGAGDLGSPANIGPSGEAGDLVSIEIHNATTESLTVILQGSDVRVEQLGPCAECQNTAAGSETCPQAAPVGRYVVKPGTYEVVVKASSGSRVTPFRGTWVFEPGGGYADCFFIRTT